MLYQILKENCNWYIPNLVITMLNPLLECTKFSKLYSLNITLGGGVMLISIGSTLLMGYVASYSYLKSKGSPKSDATKIQRIFANAGWIGKEDGEIKTIRLRRKTKIEGGTEYVYQLPLGFDRKRVIDNVQILEDGLNVRQSKFALSDFKKLQVNKNILKQLKKILNGKGSRKEIELDYDGMLIIRVFDSPMPEKIEWTDDFLKKNSWSVPVGAIRNKTIYHNFDKRKHLIVAGATGFGKSVAIKMIITSLIMSKPNDVTFSLIDLKGGVAFNRFKDCKQVKNYGRNNDEALEILKQVQQSMNAGYEKIVDGGFEDVTEAEINSRHFLIIDEAADLAGDKEAMEILTDIVRKGRGAGYYIIYTTQYPSAQAIPMQIKRNIPARLCYVLDSATASMTVLDGAGAEKLPEIPGRGIYKNVQQVILQTPFITNEQIKERIKVHIQVKGDIGNECSSIPSTEDRKHPLITEKA
jgi:hypothetical protein